MNDLKSLKIPSRLVTLAVTVIIAGLTYVSTMTPEGLAAYLPQEYAGCAALIIVLATAIVNQYSEERRVQRAEELILNQPDTIETVEDSEDSC